MNVNHSSRSRARSRTGAACEPFPVRQTLKYVDAAISYVGVTLGFAEFYESEHDRVYRSALAFCGRPDVAQDAVQEAFARAYARWRRLSRQEWVTGWVVSTAINNCRRALRRGSGEAAPGGVVSGPSADRVDVARALLALPARQRQAAVLFHIADQPITQVAELMGISEGAVKSHLDRARKSLRDALEVTDV